MSGETLTFTKSEPLTLGVELELQIVNTRDFDLSRGAPDLLRLAGKTEHPGDIKPEITESMIEVSTAIHAGYSTLLGELRAARDALAGFADRLNLAIAGGGAHPFQHWSAQRIFSAPRFAHLSELYGYLAKQFTVFGQHIHVGCPGGDDAVYLVHRLSRYIPHFIVFSGSSPFYQGQDTAFHSSRLNAISAFPLSGYMPLAASWAEFNDYFCRMQSFGIVESMKDFYWDIRPKPEYGTVEIRVCDTPLTVEKAAALAGYAQALARRLLGGPRLAPGRDQYLVYSFNRFQACRFGFDAVIVDPDSRAQIAIRDDILRTLAELKTDAAALGAEDALAALEADAGAGRSDSAWLRDAMRDTGSLHDVVRLQAERWAGAV